NLIQFCTNVWIALTFVPVSFETAWANPTTLPVNGVTKFLLKAALPPNARPSASAAYTVGLNPFAIALFTCAGRKTVEKKVSVFGVVALPGEIVPPSIRALTAIATCESEILLLINEAASVKTD